MHLPRCELPKIPATSSVGQAQAHTLSFSRAHALSAKSLLVTGMKNFYGAYAGIGFGCAPKEAQMWWDVQGPGAGCGPYPAPKPNCSFCGGRACTKSNPCFTEHNPTGVCKPGYNFVCDLCQDNATCNDLPARCPGCPVPLPALSYEWWQMPIKVEINGVACKTCLNATKPRTPPSLTNMSAYYVFLLATMAGGLTV